MQHCRSSRKGGWHVSVRETEGQRGKLNRYRKEKRRRMRRRF